jgi:hypothetical protein
MLTFVLFFVVHVIQVALAGWRNFRSMVTGYDVVDAPSATSEPATRNEEVIA